MNVPVRSQALYDELDELQAAIAEGDKEESDFAVADALDDDGTKTAAAAIKVQAVVRRQRARSEIAKKRSAVVRLQAVTRGKARRKSHLTKVGAATSMQALLRGKARRTSHLKKVGAVTSMQAVFRGQSTRGIESAAPYEPFMQGAVSHLIASGANRSESGGSSDYDYDDTSSAAGGQQSGAKQDEFGDDFFLNADPAEDDTAGDAGGANGGSRCHPVRLSPHSPRSRRVQDDTEKGTPGDDSLADLIAQMERELSGIGVGGGNYAMDSDDGDDDDDYGNDYSDENKPGGQQQQSEGAMIGRVLAGGEEFEGEEEGDSTDLEAAAVKLQAVARGKARRVSHLGKRLPLSNCKQSPVAMLVAHSDLSKRRRRFACSRSFEAGETGKTRSGGERSGRMNLFNSNSIRPSHGSSRESEATLLDVSTAIKRQRHFAGTKTATQTKTRTETRQVCIRQIMTMTAIATGKTTKRGTICTVTMTTPSLIFHLVTIARPKKKKWRRQSRNCLS